MAHDWWNQSRDTHEQVQPDTTVPERGSGSTCSLGRARPSRFGRADCELPDWLVVVAEQESGSAGQKPDEHASPCEQQNPERSAQNSAHEVAKIEGAIVHLTLLTHTLPIDFGICKWLGSLVKIVGFVKVY